MILSLDKEELSNKGVKSFRVKGITPEMFTFHVDTIEERNIFTNNLKGDCQCNLLVIKSDDLENDYLNGRYEAEFESLQKSQMTFVNYESHPSEFTSYRYDLEVKVKKI